MVWIHIIRAHILFSCIGVLCKVISSIFYVVTPKCFCHPGRVHMHFRRLCEGIFTAL